MNSQACASDRTSFTQPAKVNARVHVERPLHPQTVVQLSQMAEFSYPERTDNEVFCNEKDVRKLMAVNSQLHRRSRNFFTPLAYSQRHVDTEVLRTENTIQELSTQIAESHLLEHIKTEVCTVMDETHVLALTIGSRVENCVVLLEELMPSDTTDEDSMASTTENSKEDILDKVAEWIAVRGVLYEALTIVTDLDSKLENYQALLQDLLPSATGSEMLSRQIFDGVAAQLSQTEASQFPTNNETEMPIPSTSGMGNEETKSSCCDSRDKNLPNEDSIDDSELELDVPMPSTSGMGNERLDSSSASHQVPCTDASSETSQTETRVKNSGKKRLWKAFKRTFTCLSCTSKSLTLD